jgi:hypothetical protein
MFGVKPRRLCYSSSGAFVPDAPQKRGDDAAHPAHEARFRCALDDDRIAGYCTMHIM